MQLPQGDKPSVKIAQFVRFGMDEFRRRSEPIPTPSAPVLPEGHCHQEHCYCPFDVCDYSFRNKPYISMNNNLVPENSSIKNKPKRED
jgi:hypothetical protein